MADSVVRKDKGEVRIYDSPDELATNLADYISELSEISVKERGFFAIALSGGSLINLMRYLFAPLIFLWLCILQQRAKEFHFFY